MTECECCRKKEERAKEKAEWLQVAKTLKEARLYNTPERDMTNDRRT